MLVERIAPFLAAGLHDGTPPSPDALFQKRRQSLFERRFRQVVEQYLGHAET
jgi:hypothetical protein